jgi:hypothetical protein
VANTQISPSASVKLSAAGAGQVGLTPPSGVMWQLTLASLSIGSPVLIPQAFLYSGNSSGPVQLIDSTYAGASASSAKVAGPPVYPGTYIWAVWTGADPNVTATLQLWGMAIRNYRRGSG